MRKKFLYNFAKKNLWIVPGFFMFALHILRVFVRKSILPHFCRRKSCDKGSMAQISSKNSSLLKVLYNKECVLDLKTSKTKWGWSFQTTPKCFSLIWRYIFSSLKIITNPYIPRPSFPTRRSKMVHASWRVWRVVIYLHIYIKLRWKK